jgi:dephospho-CoA kinase
VDDLAPLPLDHPPIIGLLGGVASGKSRVAQMFAQLGAVVLEGDRIGHEVLRQPDVIASAVDRWGRGVLDASGQIDRSRLGQIVFNNAGELAYLEQLTHPRIGAVLRQRIAAVPRGTPAVVLDAAVMLKAGWYRLCDNIVFVDAPREVRLARAALRGWPASEFKRREAAQESVDEKKRHADQIIDNSASLEHTAEQVRQFWRNEIGPLADP